MQINRLFQIIYILLKKGTVTAGELAKHFEVSRRTIYRDIDALSLAGVPVYASKGKGGGISLLQDFVLDKSLLSDSEQNDILSALYGFTSIKSGDADPVLEKLGIFFGKNAVPWLKVDFSDWGDSNRDLFDILKSAILSKRVVTFSYYNSRGEKSLRKVEPIQIWFKHRAWYLRGYCLDKNEERTFKLTRIQDLTLTKETFSLRCTGDSEPTTTKSEFEMNGVFLLLRFAPEAGYRIYDEFDGSQVEKEEDGSFLVSVTWPWNDWVWGFILSFGDLVQVLQPEWVKNFIREKTVKITNLYL